MATNEILVQFVKDHNYQKTLFTRYANAQRINATGITDLYNDLRNFMTKHNNRECTIYSEYEYTDSNITEMIHKANEQGRILLEILEDSFTSETRDETIEHLKKFKELLSKQVTLEENMIYPEIEKLIIENGPPTVAIDDFDMWTYEEWFILIDVQARYRFLKLFKSMIKTYVKKWRLLQSLLGWSMQIKMSSKKA